MDINLFAFPFLLIKW